MNGLLREQNACSFKHLLFVLATFDEYNSSGSGDHEAPNEHSGSGDGRDENTDGDILAPYSSGDHQSISTRCRTHGNGAELYFSIAC